MKPIIDTTTDVKIKSINYLRENDISSLPKDELLYHLAVISERLTKSAYTFMPGELVLFRGIKYAKKLQLESDLIYPPKELASKGRVNEYGEQIFYSSNLKKAPLYELDVQIGNRLVLSKWTLDGFLFCNNIGYCDNNIKALDGLRTNPFHNPQRKFTNEEIAENSIITNFMDNVFCEKFEQNDRNAYILSNAIADVEFRSPIYRRNKDTNKFYTYEDSLKLKDEDYLIQQNDALVYPTIQNKAEGDNFAVKANIIDRRILVCESVEFIEIVDKQNSGYKYKILDFASEISDQEILWMNSERTWTRKDNSSDIYFVLENSSFTAYNEMGDVIEPD